MTRRFLGWLCLSIAGIALAAGYVWMILNAIAQHRAGNDEPLTGAVALSLFVIYGLVVAGIHLLSDGDRA